MSSYAGAYGEDQDEREKADTGHDDCGTADGLEVEWEEVTTADEDDAVKD